VDLTPSIQTPWERLFQPLKNKAPARELVKKRPRCSPLSIFCIYSTFLADFKALWRRKRVTKSQFGEQVNAAAQPQVEILLRR
jgi:hypothetical protein